MNFEEIRFKKMEAKFRLTSKNGGDKFLTNVREIRRDRPFLIVEISEVNSRLKLRNHGGKHLTNLQKI
jgi:hypothetical protein